jgi:hypothetical protein
MRPAGSAAASRPNPRAWPASGWCPCATRVREAIARQLAAAPALRTWSSRAGGSNGIPRGARAPLSTTNLRRVYKAAVGGGRGGARPLGPARPS